MKSRNLDKKILAFTLIIKASTSVQAEPVISNISFGADAQITVYGSEFGRGPNIVLYDDFETASIIDGRLELQPKIGSWYSVASSSPAIYLDQRKNKSLFVRGKGHAALVFGVEDSKGLYGLSPFTEVFFSYSVKDLAEFPGDGGENFSFSTRSSTKDAWMMLGDRGDNLSYSLSFNTPSGNDLYIPAWTGNGFNIAGNTTKLEPTFWQPELTKNWAFQDWNTTFFHAKLDPKDPYGPAEGYFGFINNNSYHVNKRSGNLIQDLRSEGLPYAYWDRIKFFAWMNEGDANVERLLDDVYVAIGPNANARVVISDAPSLEQSSHILNLPIRSWDQEKISISLPKYIMEDSQKDLYIRVINSENQSSNSLRLCKDCPVAPKLELVN
ncbi:hypothetical protein [Marinobacter shengliensis]|uniref:hypothetical protein n=1 Tax=Marinobacter shengliensis TaxID=1389223 RepID=UPI001E5E9896|nr:hypothetical protein [Marinobacter shengliensis]MCD1631309.1 hypothetical protein [Marinobacter shengliensis]